MKENSYYVEEYYKNFENIYFQDLIAYHEDIDNYFYNTYENRVSKKKDKKLNLKKDKIDVKFIFISYYIIVKKINKKSTYKEY